MLRGLPQELEAASKPGDLEGVRADAGVVLLKNRPYIFSAMTTYARDDQNAEAAIEQASRLAYEYFRRLDEGTEYGRQIDRR